MESTAYNEKRKKDWLYLLVFFLLSAANIVFALLCLYNTKVTFFLKNRTWIIISGIVFICAICVIYVRMLFQGKDVFTKAVFTAQVFLLLLFTLIYILQKSGFFDLVDTPEKLQAFLTRAGIWMPLMYIVLQYLQVVVLPIPSIVSTVAGVALFGAFYATIYSLIGIALGSITAFYIGRKLGYKAVAWIVGGDTLKSWRRKLKGKDNILLTLMFALPLFPDDVLCFVAGLSSMNARYFLVMMLVTRALGIFGTCYSVDIIPFNTWWGIVIWAFLILGTLLSFIFLSKNMNKVQLFIRKIKFKVVKNKKNK